MAQAKYEIRRKCPICGAVFQIRTIDSVYCSKQCSDVAYKRKKDREAKEAKYEQMAKEIPDIREFLSVQEAVAVYCVERDTLYREIRKDKIPAVNLGTKQLRLNRADLEQRYPRRKKVRKAAQKPIPKTYNMEPENCYTIGEISKMFRIHDLSVWAHIRKFSIPTRQIGNYVTTPRMLRRRRTTTTTTHASISTLKSPRGARSYPIGSNPIPLHQRLQQRHDELGFKPYMDANHPDQIAKNSPNGLVNIIFGGDHEVMKRLAFGEQQIDTSDPYADNSHIMLIPAIYEWAKDTYQFCCRMWGEENIIGFDVHCDETGVHAHALTVPVEQVKKRGRIGSQYINKNTPDKVLTTKEWRALPKEERGNYIKTESTKGVVERVSYAKVWGETAKDKSEYLSDLHTKYYNEVGNKYGLERGIPYEELSEEEKRERRHKSKVVLEAERQAKQAIAEAEKLKAEIEAEASIATQQKEKAQKELKSVQSGFLAKIFQPGKYKKEESVKLKESYDAGVTETIGAFIKAAGLKWKSEPTVEILGQQFRMSWDTNKNLSNELRTKEGIISSKDVEIRGLRAKVTTLTEELNGLKYRLTLIDENAVERLRNAKNAETARADKAESELDSLQSAYHNLLRKWNALWMEPEYNEAARKVKERKEREARLATEKQDRYQKILNRFIAEGRTALRAFALSNRTNFNDKEAASIYYGIIAVTHKMKLSLGTKEGITSAVNNFLSGMSWRDCSKFNVDCVTIWTHLFAERDVTYETSIIDNFISFVDYMSCSTETYTSVGGSNGCADQLTNWDETKKLGLGEPVKKKGQSC